jgi:phage host-nuclease inhibitor protein Gam
MSKQLNRKNLTVNNRKNVKSVFQYVAPTVKSVANPSILNWPSLGRGVEGESVNSGGDNFIVKKNEKPL